MRSRVSTPMLPVERAYRRDGCGQFASARGPTAARVAPLRAPGLDQDLHLLARLLERAEGARHALEADLRGDERRRGEGAGGQMLQCRSKLLRRVGEHELELDLLGDADRGLDAIRLHAYADHHDARRARR